MAVAVFELMAVGFRDSDGVLRAAIIEDMSDDIALEGWEEDEQVIFEAEAYHLRRWCKDHGFEYLESANGEIEIELEPA